MQINKFTKLSNSIIIIIN